MGQGLCCSFGLGGSYRVMLGFWVIKAVFVGFLLVYGTYVNDPVLEKRGISTDARAFEILMFFWSVISPTRCMF